MSFLHLSLLTLGGLFVAVPVVLHLAMRQKPRHQVFPALRFLQQRQVTNRRRLQLRQAALLVLRCLIVMLLALALARPSVGSEQLGGWLVAGMLGLLLLLVGWLATVAAIHRRGWLLVTILGLLSVGLLAGLVNSALALIRNKPPILLGDRKAAVAAALIVDTSLRMTYRYNNQSRLERAQDVSQWLLRQLPADSQVALLDSSTGAPSFSVDLGAARVAVESLEATDLPQPLSRLIDGAIRLLDESEKPRKELYIVSDLTQATWDDLNGGAISEVLQQATDVSIQVIDVGVENPVNTSLVDLELPNSSLTPGSPVQIRARAVRIGGPENVTLELFVETDEEAAPLLVDGALQTPPATVRGQRTIAFDGPGAEVVEFSLASLPLGTQHGYVAINGVDGLPVDDRVDFTVHVRAPWSVLIVAGPGSEPSFITERLAPLEFREKGRAKFDCSVISMDQLSQATLSNFDAVGLLDPPPLDDSSWLNLQRYLERGGGVAVFLGRNLRSAAEFNTPAAVALLPAPIQRQWRAPSGIALAPRNYDDPLLWVMRDIRTTIPWDAMPVFQHWVVGDLAPESRSLIEFSNNKPAVLERQVGSGKLILMTTPASDPDVVERPPWNLLPTSFNSWPFMILVDRLFLSLVKSNDAPLNYLVGQPAVLPVDSPTADRFSLFTPNGTWLEMTSLHGQIQVPFTEVPGTYRLNVPLSDRFPRGFSVNLPESACRLERIELSQLDRDLGTGRYRYAKTEAEIVRDIDQSRVGKEFYPFLLPLLMVVLALEYVVSNRFYPERPQ